MPQNHLQDHLQDHEHDHQAHPAGHRHGHQGRPALRWSLLRVSSGQRVMGVAVLLALLWLATYWALT